MIYSSEKNYTYDRIQKKRTKDGGQKKSVVPIERNE